MNEEQIKALCKFLVENGNRNLSVIEKELLKQAIDKSHNWLELFATMMLAKKQQIEGLLAEKVLDKKYKDCILYQLFERLYCDQVCCYGGILMTWDNELDKE